MSLDTEFHRGGTRWTWRALIKHELRGWETQHNHDPSGWSWVDNIRIPSADFYLWLKAANRAHQFPTRPKRRAGAKTKRGRIKKFIEATYPGGVPECLSYKQIANQAGQALGEVFSARTFARALGRR
jgi:hypothetical protein